jgi:hypothetical protein
MKATQSGIILAMMQMETQKEKENGKSEKRNCPCKTER